MSTGKCKILILLLFLGFTIFLTLNRHSKSRVQNYHSEIWGDKAGYYIYLPSVFIYNFDTQKLPSDIEAKTGNGFSIQNSKIITKYPCGVALMQSPFFLAGHYLSKYCGYEDDGFSKLYHKSINIAAVVYSFFAFIFLYLFLIRYLDEKISVLTLVCLYLGTNIFYYSIFETGMSHIYSFFLFTCFLYLSPFITGSNQSKIHYILFGLVTGLIIIVRPINILFLPVFFIFNNPKTSEIKNLLTGLIYITLAAMFVVLPQLLYWKYAFGNYFVYSYGEEGFTNAWSPKLLQLWFSTNNGLFIYNPLVVLVLSGLAFYYKESPQKSIITGLYFLCISILFSAWHDWSYGCSYGSRPFVEYFSILALPFGYLLKRLKTNFKFKPVIILLLAISIFYNQKLMFSYDGCWYGGDWDWPALLKLTLSSPK